MDQTKIVFKVIYRYPEHIQLMTKYFSLREKADAYVVEIEKEFIAKGLDPKDPHSEFPYIREVIVID